MVQRLGSKDNEIMELRASVSGLETTVDMIRTGAGAGQNTQVHIIYHYREALYRVFPKKGAML